MTTLFTGRALQRATVAARDGRIDETAPVQATASATSDATPSLVWEVLADVESWPTFVPGVTRAHWTTSTGPVASARFSWRSAGTPIRSTLEVATPGRELTWTGTALWLTAVHRNVIEPCPTGGARITSSESMDGFLTRQLMSSSRLEEQLHSFVQAISAEAERRGD